MKQVAEGKNYTAVDIGGAEEVKTYSLIHAKTGKEVQGKLFLKEPTGATGTEISFTSIPPRSEAGYFHKHAKDEETYIILNGSGYYQVDEDCFPIKAGSVVRVAPEGGKEPVQHLRGGDDLSVHTIRSEFAGGTFIRRRYADRQPPEMGDVE